jgi:hypothetical protein
MPAGLYAFRDLRLFRSPNAIVLKSGIFFVAIVPRRRSPLEGREPKPTNPSIPATEIATGASATPVALPR